MSTVTLEPVQTTARPATKRNPYYVLMAVAAVAAAIYFGCIISPPSLMDDVDAVQAQIARNMMASGDWVTARLDGVVYMEKAPLTYWLIAGSYKIFGVTDWAARIPIAFGVVGLALVTALIGIWAFGRRTGLYAGLTISTCIGLFLFTRILIPDVILTLAITVSLWAFLRAMEPDERRPGLWMAVYAAGIGVGLLLKSLIALVFPVGAALVYLLITRQLFSRSTWKRLHPFSAALVVLAIAAPWHVLATLRNPPYFVFTMRSAPGEYHGFFWFYFINEQLLRFLNMRYPRDYDTVPRFYFWTFHLLWLFPWSMYFPALGKLSYRPTDRAGRMRLLALCWIGVVMVFFTFSTTQEYYSMPCYPAIALLLGSGMVAGGKWIRRGNRAIGVLAAVAGIACLAILFSVRNLPTPGDIASALSPHPKAYTLSLGHMEDLTFDSFAYLRLPLGVAGIAFLIGAFGSWQKEYRRVFFSSALMMILFFHAARLAMVVFDPYMSSKPLADALNKAPEGELIVDHHYYDFSSVFFYTNRTALLLNGRFNNLVYGSYAPGCPPVFIDDDQFRRMWAETRRLYLVIENRKLARVAGLVGAANLHLVKASGGKSLLTNE